jgi:hypothetical protein
MDETLNEEIYFDSREQARDIALNLVQQAKREIYFFGADLDAPLFDHVDMLTALSEFARRSERTSVKFLIHSSKNNIQQNHQLIALAERLPSSIEIRITATQHQQLPQSFLITDDTGYLFRKTHAHYSGLANFNNRHEVRALKQTFSDVWNHSISDVNIRRLHL